MSNSVYGVGGMTIITINANTTITFDNCAPYNQQNVTVVFGGAYTLTVNAGASLSGFAFRPPAAGNATFASDGTVLLNAATTSLTRALSASQQLLAFSPIGQDSYAVTGS